MARYYRIIKESSSDVNFKERYWVESKDRWWYRWGIFANLPFYRLVDAKEAIDNYSKHVDMVIKNEVIKYP